jgi:flavin-binding protein dodecin
MPDTRIITEVSSSAGSIEEAMEDGVLRAGADPGVESVRIKEVDVRFELGKIAGYWVTLEVTYADKVEPTLQGEGEGSEGASPLELVRQRVLLENLAQEELDKSGRFLDITPAQKGSGSTDVSVNHDRYLTEG